MRLSAALLLIVTLIAGGRADPLMAQSGDDPGETSRPLPTPNEQFGLSAPSTGTEYEISIYLPESYGTGDDDFSVLYALDGDASFDELAARAVRESIHFESIVVGIGYGLPPDDRRPLRLRDCTPSPVPGLDGSGGAADFLRFIERTLAPHLESRFRIDRTRRVLAGHSLGGFLVLYALFSTPSEATRIRRA